MKKSLILILIMLLCLSIVSCYGPQLDTLEQASPTPEPTPSPTPEPTPEPIPLVGISMLGGRQGWVEAVRNTADDLDLNYDLHISSDSQAQAETINELIALECDYILLFPQDEQLAYTAKRVLDAGIPLIVFGYEFEAIQPDYVVSIDNAAVGKTGGEYIAESLEGKGRVAIIDVPLFGKESTDRADAVYDALSQYDSVKVLDIWELDGFSEEYVFPVVADRLFATPKVDAVYVPYADMVDTVIQAFNQTGRTDLKVIAGGTYRNTEKDVIGENPDLSIGLQDYPDDAVVECIKMIASLIDGEQPAAITSLTPTSNATEESEEGDK